MGWKGAVGVLVIGRAEWGGGSLTTIRWVGNTYNLYYLIYST